MWGRWSDHTLRHSFAVPLMYVEVVMENIMPIRIRHRDKNTAAVQQADIAWIIIEMRSFLQASYKALERLLGVIRIHINIVSGITPCQ